MSEAAGSNRLGRWLRRHSLTLVAALGGAAGVAYAAGWHGGDKPTPTSSVAVTTTTHAVTTSVQPQPEPAKPAEPPRDNVQDTVQIALLLDTSGSMDGLINQARSHMWNIVDQMGRMTRVVDGKIRGVKIELALYEYGNDAISAKEGYIRQVMPFTSDLDKVSEKLHALFTNGGTEHHGEAIATAIDQLQWSSAPDAMKFVFLAGNEEFDQGPVSIKKAIDRAAQKDIHVQLIHCGTGDVTWKRAAKIAKTDLVEIDHNHVAQHIPAPQDDEIVRIGEQLNRTYIAYGAEGAASVERQKKADMSSAKMSPKVAVERAQLKGKASYKNDHWDVVDAKEKNAKFFEQTPDDALPAELRGKSVAEKEAYVAAKAKERAELQAKLAKLEAERRAFLDEERKKRGEADAKSLETELMKTTKKIAGKKGFK